LNQPAAPDDPLPAPAPIYTIGYGSRTMDEFLSVLAANAIEYLIDIRSSPYSRFKPEFSRRELELRLKERGIRYLYLGDQLGGQPADRTCYVGDKVVYQLLAEKPYYQEGIRRVRNAFERQLHVALMCSEGKPTSCHRSKLIGQTLVNLDVPVSHIDENGQLRSQAEVEAELTGGQLGLFEENTFTSRRRHPVKGEDDGA
jgi:uncharacterized protein (DUF488 family)